MSITSLTQVTALVEEETAKIQDTIETFIIQKACYYKNKALSVKYGPIWAEQELLQIAEDAKEKNLVTFLGKALETAEEGLRIANENLAVVQTEINELARIQDKVLALLTADGVDVSLFIDCSLTGTDSFIESLTDVVEVTASITELSTEGVSLDIDVPVPDINIPRIDVVEDAQEAASRVGGVVGTMERIKETQKEVKTAAKKRAKELEEKLT
tara:strand:+ start:27 stop:668 length:642 start_codon:yes stop_codon:yes gene_type:complete